MFETTLDMLSEKPFSILSNFNIVVIACRGWSDVDVVLLLDRCYIWVSSFGRERLGLWRWSIPFRGKELFLVASVESIWVDINPCILHSIVDVLKIVVLHRLHMRYFIGGLKVIILLLSLHSVRIMRFSFRYTSLVRLRLRVFLIKLVNRDLQNFRRNWSVLLWWPNLRRRGFINWKMRWSCWRNILVLHSNVRRMLGRDAVRLLELPSSLFGNIV